MLNASLSCPHGLGTSSLSDTLEQAIFLDLKRKRSKDRQQMLHAARSWLLINKIGVDAEIKVIEAQAPQVEDWSLRSVLFCMLQMSGDFIATAEGGCSSRNTLFPSLLLPTHIVSPRPCQIPSWTLFISNVLDSCSIIDEMLIVRFPKHPSVWL